jgi:hypothetical protein
VAAQLLATQVVQLVQVAPLQHMLAHWDGLVPAIVQRWKQPMLEAQEKLLRHISVWLQQLPMMHWLHGVPPGSREQLPASMGGMPQWPPLQVRPTQHWPLFWHEEPGGRHPPVPHTLLSHTIEQH